ncbi:hypothetical protein OC861_000346 [Tilletia horrida]|nr:hypothetical protein OC861_000346 [Tilletia horrida]
MVKHDHIPTAFFEHDFEQNHDPFGLTAFYSNPIGPNFHSRRADEHSLHHPRHFIHQEPKDDLFALRGEPFPASGLQIPATGFNKASHHHQHQHHHVPLPTFLAQPKFQPNRADLSNNINNNNSRAIPPVFVDPEAIHAPEASSSSSSAVEQKQVKLEVIDELKPADLLPAATPSSSSSAATQAKAGSSQPKKRTRPVSACEGCRAKKVKCNLKPDLPICENCSLAGKTCLFRIDDLSPAFRAQRFAAYGPPGEDARTIGQKCGRSAEDVSGETAAQRRLRRKRAKEALLATGQRPPKAKAVFKSWANPSKLAAPCVPFTFTSGMATPTNFNSGAETFAQQQQHQQQQQQQGQNNGSFAFGPSSPQQMINASGMYHAASSSVPSSSPPSTAAASVGSWESAATATFPHSFGSSLSSSMQHGIPIPMGNFFNSTAGSPQGSLGSSFTMEPHTPGLTDGSGDLLNMSPHSGAIAMSPTTPSVPSAPHGSGAAAGEMANNYAALRFSHAAVGVSSAGGNGASQHARPEMHARRHTTGPSITSMPIPSPFGGPADLIMAQTPLGNASRGLESYPFPGSNGGSSHEGSTGASSQGHQDPSSFSAVLMQFQQSQSLGGANHSSSTSSSHNNPNSSSSAAPMGHFTDIATTNHLHNQTMHHSAHDQPPPTRPPTASGFLSDFEALTGFPSETFGETAVPVDLMSADEFMGFEMTLA